MSVGSKWTYFSELCQAAKRGTGGPMSVGSKCPVLGAVPGKGTGGQMSVGSKCPILGVVFTVLTYNLLVLQYSVIILSNNILCSQ